MSNLPDPKTNEPKPTTSSSGLGTKEREINTRQDEADLEAVRQEFELAPEIKEVVEIHKEEIELPSPLPKMGVTQVGADLPINLLTVKTPLADEKILSGRKAPVTDNLRWLVEWCLKQLAEVHIKLKKINGRIVRIKIK